jgi:hypothetical protein
MTFDIPLFTKSKILPLLANIVVLLREAALHHPILSSTRRASVGAD